ncbi:hypothetical protein IPA_04300 [Ignicoccus pacificus DSM 13166]|uniref:Thioredoxin domain-containing protein n=1 Tax=Ignicoccus pacificus DSM 13166 TaxID=940294 RepID=A0A977PLJ3_9CREN|nr:hypothetical protein IPA_04300 [Ignicoccus pacificus DSM 13166]
MLIINKEDFEKEKKEGVTVVVFTADWIEESKRLYEKMMEELEGFNCKVREVDVSITPSIMDEEKVYMIPTVKVFINGETVLVQEGTTGNLTVDVEHVRRAMKESMKKRNIPLRS